MLPKVTDQLVPEGSPVSENVTVYKTGLNKIAMFKLLPFTLKDPWDGEGAYNLLTVAIVKLYVPLGSLIVILEPVSEKN